MTETTSDQETVDADPRGGPPAPGDDSVLPFQLDHLDLRGRVARLDQTLDRILTQHRYPQPVCALVGEAALLTAMIGQAMKLRGRFSVQARGDGPVGLIATDYYPPKQDGAVAKIRAYAQFDEARTPDAADDPFALLGEGLFAMTIDQGPGMAPYQGLTPLVPGGLSACAETYFAQSEQVATRFQIALGLSAEPGEVGGERWRGGGVMLQHLAEFGEGAEAPAEPSGAEGLMSAQDVADLSDRSDDWRRANMLLDTVDAIELVGPHVSPESLVWRLFNEEQPRVYPPQAVAFGCSCDGANVEALLKQYPADAVREMTTEAGDIVADCQFCGAQYRFELSDIIDE